MQSWAADPEKDAQDREREAAEKEDKEQREDEEALQRARAMDEWKDGEFYMLPEQAWQDCFFLYGHFHISSF